MKSSLTALRTKARRAAFTLIETSVALAISVGIGLTAYQALRSGLWLSSEITGLNVSSFRSRTIIDQIGTRARYALEQPSLINSDGSANSGSSADGIMIKRLLGDPYVVKDTSDGTADIPATATQFVVDFRIGLPIPVIGDWIQLESVTRPQLQITNVGTMANNGTVQRRLLTTATAVGEILEPSGYRIGGNLFRKEAYVFVNTSAATNPFAMLQHYERVTASTVWNNAASYQLMASDYRRLSGGNYFVNSTSNGAVTTTVHAICNSSAKAETVARGNTVSSYTSLPVQLRLWSINR